MRICRHIWLCICGRELPDNIVRQERKVKMTAGKAVIRLIVAVMATVNAMFVAAGKNPLPFDETLVTEWLTYLFDAVMLIWVWWKDAPLTDEAAEAHKGMVAEKILNRSVDETRKEMSDGRGEDNE